MQSIKSLMVRIDGDANVLALVEEQPISSELKGADDLLYFITPTSELIFVLSPGHLHCYQRPTRWGEDDTGSTSGGGASFSLRGKVEQDGRLEFRYGIQIAYLDDDRLLTIGERQADILVAVDLMTWQTIPQSSAMVGFVPRTPLKSRRQHYYDIYLPLLACPVRDDDRQDVCLCTDLVKLTIDYLITDRIFPALGDSYH